MRRNGKANCYMVNIARGCVTFFFFFLETNTHKREEMSSKSTP